MNLVLIGYRGTGKSTIGRQVSGALGMPYLGLDDEIVRRAGTTIPEIVGERGWTGFRDLEEEVVRWAATRSRHVVDTGGGVVTRPVNIERLRAGGRVFLLESSVEDIVARIGGDAQRPSLTGTKSVTDEVVDVLREREPLYRAAAHHVIDTSRLDPEAAVERICTLYRADAAEASDGDRPGC